MIDIYLFYKYRLYPNKQQEELIKKTFGCVRFVYNQCLAYRKEKYENEKISLSRIDLNNWKNHFLKKEYEWLNEVDKFALDNAVINLDSAYQKFFKEHIGYPKFKSKKCNRKSYKTNFSNNNIEIDFENNKIKLPKLKWVKIKISRLFDGKIKSSVISQVPSGKYYVSILVEKEDFDNLPKTDNCIGIDLGIKELVTDSNGCKYNNKKINQQYEKKLAREQRRLVHKKKGSNNYEKQRIRLTKVYEKISNKRRDYLHKLSRKIINENQVIVTEDLNVNELLKNKNISKKIIDCGWYELTRQLQYKADWYGRTYVKVDKYYPSSQLCSVCGYKNEEVKDLSMRKWICQECGTKHDRDVNAAKNILAEGLRILTEPSEVS